MNYHRNSNKSDGTSFVKELKKGSVLRVAGSRSGQSISCLNGTIWLTQQGDDRDRFLDCCENYHSHLPNVVLIQALDDARVKICPERKKRLFGWFPRIRERVLSHA